MSMGSTRAANRSLGRQPHGTNRALTRAGDTPAAGVADQERQKVYEHGLHQGGQPLVREPTIRDEQRRDQTPRDERPDVGHHHAAEETPEPLDPHPHAGPASARLTTRRTRLSHYS